MIRVAEQFFVVVAATVFAASLISCGDRGAPAQKSGEAAPAASLVPPEIQRVADRALGDGAQVVAFGNLSGTGNEQVLAVRSLHSSEETSGSEMLVSQAVIVEKEEKGWKEVLRCDENLKNPAGYLSGAPRNTSAGWHLRFVAGTPGDTTLYLMPISVPGTKPQPAVAVRWNPALKRYQSFDLHIKQFLSEEKTLEMPEVPLRP